MALVAVVALAGCSTVNQQGGSGAGGHGMMGSSDSTYHYSRVTCPVPATVAGAPITVLLGDMGMTSMMTGTAPLGARMMLRAVPATVRAGPVTFIAENMGWRMHELVILPLVAGASPGQRVSGTDGKVDESGSLGEASASCGAGAGDGIPSGSASWTTVTLAPGRYELVCNLPNHYADGMHQEIVVTA